MTIEQWLIVGTVTAAIAPLISAVLAVAWERRRLRLEEEKARREAEDAEDEEGAERMQGFQKGGYSHGTDASDQQQSITYDGCTEVDCLTAIQTGRTVSGTHIIDNIRVNSGAFIHGDEFDTVTNSP